MVWLFWPRPPIRQKFRKLQKLWTGPWKIESFKIPVAAVLTHTVKRTRQTVHVDRLLPCNISPPIETDFGNPPDVETPTDGKFQLLLFILWLLKILKINLGQVNVLVTLSLHRCITHLTWYTLDYILHFPVYFLHILCTFLPL